MRASDDLTPLSRRSPCPETSSTASPAPQQTDSLEAKPTIAQLRAQATPTDREENIITRQIPKNDPPLNCIPDDLWL